MPTDPAIDTSQVKWDQSSKINPAQVQWDSSPDPVATGVANTAVRDLARGIIGAVTFVPDIATTGANLIGGAVDRAAGIKEPDIELPSSFWNRQLDKVTTKPTTTTGKVTEEIAAGLVGGAATMERGAAKAVGEGASRGVRSLEEEAPQLNRVQTLAAEQAHAAGYNLPPSYIGGEIARDVQGAAGKAATERVMSEGNEVVTDRLAKLALGLHPNEELTPATFDKIRNEAYQAYDDVKQLGVVKMDNTFLEDLTKAGSRFESAGAVEAGATDQAALLRKSIDAERAAYLKSSMSSSDMLTNIRMLRQLSRGNLKNYDIEKNAIGYTQREIANALEMQLERASASNPTLVKNLRAAREQIAKIANVEDSIGASGHVRADDLRRLKDAGVPLSGPLKTIADTAKNFPKAVQPIAEKGREGAFSVVDYLLGGTGVATGHVAVPALSLARPVARRVLGSESVQKSMVRGLRPTKIGEAIGKAGRAASKAVKPVAKAVLRGEAIMGTEDLAENSVP